jgi:hypothetical protein
MTRLKALVACRIAWRAREYKSTCFTGTKIQILTQKALLARRIVFKARGS